MHGKLALYIYCTLLFTLQCQLRQSFAFPLFTHIFQVINPANIPINNVPSCFIMNSGCSIKHENIITSYLVYMIVVIVFFFFLLLLSSPTSFMSVLFFFLIVLVCTLFLSCYSEIMIIFYSLSTLLFDCLEISTFIIRCQIFIYDGVKILLNFKRILKIFFALISLQHLM